MAPIANINDRQSFREPNPGTPAEPSQPAKASFVLIFPNDPDQFKIAWYCSRLFNSPPGISIHCVIPENMLSLIELQLPETSCTTVGNDRTISLPARKKICAGNWTALGDFNHKRDKFTDELVRSIQASRKIGFHQSKNNDLFNIAIYQHDTDYYETGCKKIVEMLRQFMA